MIKIKEKEGYMGQYLGDVDLNAGDDYHWDIDENEDLRKIKFRLGSLIITFNHIESELERILCEWLGNGREHETGMMIVGTMSYMQKVSFLESFFLRYDKMGNNGKNRSYIKKVCEKLRMSGKLRNACVHAYRHDRNDNSFVRVRNKFDENGIKIVYRSIDSKTLDEYISFIANIEYMLDELNERIEGSF